jgi:hypothetical protein
MTRMYERYLGVDGIKLESGKKPLDKAGKDRDTSRIEVCIELFIFRSG